MKTELDRREGEMSLLVKDSEKREKELESLRNEKQRLNEEIEKAQKEKQTENSEADMLKEEVATLRREIVDVCQVLKEEQDDRVKLTEELAKLRKELEVEKSEKSKNSNAKRKVGEKNKEEVLEFDRLKTDGISLASKNVFPIDDVKQLNNELHRLKNQLLSERTDFEQERITWAQEKEKVLRYQRQLQLNYVQMFRRTRTLEAEVESLTMELELETKTKGFRNAKKISVPAVEMGTIVEL